MNTGSKYADAIEVYEVYVEAGTKSHSSIAVRTQFLATNDKDAIEHGRNYAEVVRASRADEKTIIKTLVIVERTIGRWLPEQGVFNTQISRVLLEETK